MEAALGWVCETQERKTEIMHMVCASAGPAVCDHSQGIYFPPPNTGGGV